MGLFSLSVEVRKRPPWRQTFRPEDSPRRPHFIPSSGRRTRGRRAGLAPGSGASTGLSKLQTLRGTLSAEVLGTLVGLHNPTPAPGRDQGNLRKLKERVPVSPPGDSRCLKPPPPARALCGAPDQLRSCPLAPSSCPQASNSHLLELNSFSRSPALRCLIPLSGTIVPQGPSHTPGSP